MKTKKQKDSSLSGRTYLQVTYLVRDFYVKYIKIHISIIKRQSNQLKNGQKDVNRHFSKHTQMANKHMKKSLNIVSH